MPAGSTGVGTKEYCAPEVLRRSSYSKAKDEALGHTYRAARDLWALGEILFQMLVKRPAFESPYDVYRFADGHESLQEQLMMLTDRGLSSDCRKFIEKLLLADPTTRMSASEATSHPWLQSAALPSPSSSRSSTP